MVSKLRRCFRVCWKNTSCSVGPNGQAITFAQRNVLGGRNPHRPAEGTPPVSPFCVLFPDHFVSPLLTDLLFQKTLSHRHPSRLQQSPVQYAALLQYFQYGPHFIVGAVQFRNCFMFSRVKFLASDADKFYPEAS